MLNYSRGVLIAIGTTALIATGGALSAAKPRGEAAPLEVVHSYLVALEHQDLTALSRLTPSNYRSDAELQAKLAQWGGQHIENHRVFRTKTEPSAVRLKIYGSYQQNGKTAKFVDTIPLVYRREGLLRNPRWLLALGSPPVTQSPKTK
jgi:hypothetical protein